MGAQMVCVCAAAPGGLCRGVAELSSRSETGILILWHLSPVSLCIAERPTLQAHGG